MGYGIKQKKEGACIGGSWKFIRLQQDVRVICSRFLERYGLIDQIRRASYSVTANIVEGQSRNTTKEYLYFLHNARGSVEEVRYFILLSKDLDYINDAIHQGLESQYETVSKMLNGLIKSLKT